ncbi:SDR family NAD(P)-dependent oxidoreductase [Lentzea sp. E54]|uniref:SDR family NAD(P)-dependent oxidoreductase n=1 Tax=Lentzea xerophila TaxID=3435883 RepID=UPI003DA4EADB
MKDHERLGRVAWEMQVIVGSYREKKLSLNEKVPGSWAMVTGSTSGIGRVTALGLAEDGYSIVVCGRDKDRAAETRKLIESAGGRAFDLIADFSDPAAVRGLVAEVNEILDGDNLDVLVNNAGGGGFAPTEDTTDEMFDTAFNLNVKAPYILTGAFAPAMARRGQGAIVNVGSLSTTMAAAGTSAFQAAKAALNMLTKSWTAEYGPRGVRVNSVDPGYILTPVNEHMREMYGGYLAGVPAGRGGKPEEVAEAIRFLVSLRASYIQGAVLTVDGGKTSVVAM